jgi:hypothetical protein
LYLLVKASLYGISGCLAHRRRGNNMITPYRKPAGCELLDWQREYNSQVNKIRWMIEQAISLQELDHHAHRLPAPAQNI